MSLSQYLIDIQAESRALCTFLNDGVEIPETEEDLFLYVEINSPREITTKVLTLDEMKSAAYKDAVVFKK